MRLDHFSWTLDMGERVMYFRVKESITDFPFPKTIFIRQFPPFDFDRVAAKKILPMCFLSSTFGSTRENAHPKKDITR